MPLEHAKTLVASWAADNRYYFDAPLHPKAAADLAARIAEAVDIAVKQAGTMEKPIRKSAREKA